MMIKKLLLKLEHKIKTNRRSKENRFVVDFLSNIDFKKINNIRPSKIKKISFILPPLSAYSGGHTSVFRLGTRLAQFGYEVEYIIFGAKRNSESDKIADTLLKDRKGEIKFWDEQTEFVSDIVIATNIESVFFAKKMSGYKFMFVQDFEPYFYERGDRFLYASKIYDLGFHLISLGGWNKKQIEKHTENSSRIDVIDFPYEPKEYNFPNRDYAKYKNKEDFKLCIYIRTTPRRLPFFCQFLAGKLIEEFERQGKKLEVFYFGEDKAINYLNGKNIGKLSKSELQNLYRSCDFGMVASLTNISLVPYEMMATGLPIIEFKQGSFCDFFDEDAAFLFDYDCDSLCKEIIRAINNPEILEERNLKIQNVLQNLSWDKTAEQFLNIIKSVEQE